MQLMVDLTPVEIYTHTSDLTHTLMIAVTL